MNCRDISLALDDRDLGALNAAERRELDAHLARCPSCARELEIHEGLVAAPVPRMPVDMPARIRQSLVARAARDRRRGRHRVVLVSLVVALAAVAMVVDMQRNTPAAVASMAIQPRPAAAPTVPEPPAAPESPAVPEPREVAPVQAQPIAEATGGVARPPQPVVISVELENQAEGAAAAAAEVFRTSYIGALAATTGVIVLGPDSPDAVADRRVRIRSAGPLAGGKFRVDVSMESRGADGNYRFDAGSSTIGDIEPSCAGLAQSGPVHSCNDPGSMAIAEVRNLNQLGFVRGPASQPGAQSQLLTLAANSGEATVRAGAWRALRDVDQSGVMQPMIELFEREPSASVRTQALLTLMAWRGTNPAVRDSLELAAQTDPHRGVRSLARTMLSGGTAWSDYVTTSLNDASLFDAERLEPLLISMDQPANAPLDMRGVLQSEQVVHSLEKLLSTRSDLRKDRRVARLMSTLAATGHPAMVNLVLANLEQLRVHTPPPLFISMLARYKDDARVRAELQRVALGDADLKMREAAASALK